MKRFFSFYIQKPNLSPQNSSKQKVHRRWCLLKFQPDDILHTHTHNTLFTVEFFVLQIRLLPIAELATAMTIEAVADFLEVIPDVCSVKEQV